MSAKRGTDNVRSKLSEEDVLAIYEDVEHTQHWLAEKYGVSQSTINHIRKGRSWRWLTKHGE